MIEGIRGLPGSSSLPKLLAEHHGVRNIGNVPLLTIQQILGWADEHYKRTGKWPNHKSGPVKAAKGEIWAVIDGSLQKGRRGLLGGSSLTRLLSEHRGVRNPKEPPMLTIKQILKWADEHKKWTGEWPTRKSGPVISAYGEPWSAIEAALRNGTRGLPGGSSIAKLLS